MPLVSTEQKWRNVAFNTQELHVFAVIHGIVLVRQGPFIKMLS